MDNSNNLYSKDDEFAVLETQESLATFSRNIIKRLGICRKSSGTDTLTQILIEVILVFCSLVIFIKKFDPINIRRPWAPAITMFCSEFIVTKTFTSIKARRPWPPIWFHTFLSKDCFSFYSPFYTWGVVGYISLVL